MNKKEIQFPVLNVKMVDIDKVVANDYNPNKVAPPEMQLLKHSIEEDGYTQPIVTYYDKQKDIYIVVDGFHRYRVAKEFLNLKQVPIVTIDKDLEMGQKEPPQNSFDRIRDCFMAALFNIYLPK